MEDLRKKIKLSIAGQTVELQEDRNLFARMVLVCKSRPEIDIREAVGTYEFTVVPRSMFAVDGEMLHCSTKSALMSILEKLPNSVSTSVCNTTFQDTENQEERMRVSVIDAMAEVQSLDKPEWIRTCSNLADHFTSRIFEKYRYSDEIRLIFDRYDLPSSLKEATRLKRQGEQDQVYYRITSSTQIAKITMKKLLSHVKTKKELTKYLAEKTIEHAQRNGTRVVVAYGCDCIGSKKDMTYLKSDQEEADTKIILHALDASANGATEIRIYSPDTDVFVLSLRRFPDLCPNTTFITGKGQRHREIKLQPIVDALGPLKTAALPAFHALTGADNTGSFANRGKVLCWKAYIEASNNTIHALSILGTDNLPSAVTVAAVEKLVCHFFLPNTESDTVKELRWWLFRKKQARSERLPPTKAALYQSILRAHYQLLVWNNDGVANPALPSPKDYGWEWKEDLKMWKPVMTTLPPAPDAIIHLVKCNCNKERCATKRCQCRKAGLNCTDLCGCCDVDDECENMGNETDEDEGDDNSDSDDNSDTISEEEYDNTEEE